MKKAADTLANLLVDDAKIRDVIIEESEELLDAYDTPRRSVICPDEATELKTEDLLHKERLVKNVFNRQIFTILHRTEVTLTTDGYVHRETVAELRKSASSSSIAVSVTCYSTDKIVFVSSK